MSRKVFKLDCFITVHMSRNKYRKVTECQVNAMKRLALEGKSIRQIRDIMNISLSLVYYHVKELIPKQSRKLNLNGISESQIGELMGAFAGDGSFYISLHKGIRHYKTRYTLCTKTEEERVYIGHLQELLRRLNLNPYILNREKEGCLDIGLNSKGYFNLITKFLVWEGKKALSVRLRLDFNAYSKEFLTSFARGLMDTDGWVSNSNVSCGSISKNLIADVAKIFTKFDIIYTRSKRNAKNNQKELYLIRVRKQSLQKYLEIIGFSNPRKLNKLKAIL